MSRVYVMYGSDGAELALSILEKMQVAEELAALGRELGRRPLIGLKPNLVVAQPAEWGATTSPALVRGVLRYLSKEHGFDNVTILESSWAGESTERAFAACGYNELAQEFGVPLIDLKKDAGVPLVVEGLELAVCRRALELDYLISLPVLKAHCQTRLTCALKNLKGCVPDSEKKRFHALGLHRPIACLNKALKSRLTVVDGIIGDLCHEEGGTPVRMNRVIAGRDPVAVDAYVAALLGYSTEEIPYLGMAEKMGVGSTEYELVELQSEKAPAPPEAALAGRTAESLSKWIAERQACSPCYGSVVHALMRLKEKGQLKGKWQVAVGQGCRGLTGELGVGECAKGFRVRVAGCPPPAKEIVEMLLAWLAGETAPQAPTR
ncbi:MAG: DUF362 domain-containing protein [Dethiobacter sp.]|nr:DUF362 domain-containing protein [Dethiobacter sp.]